jgi:hypothetical protein
VAITSNQCAGNHSPQIGNLRYLVNDELVEASPTVSPDDDLKIWIQYQDADCNLGGGGMWWSIDGGEFAAVKQLAGDFSCNGVGDNRGIVYQPDLGVLNSGVHQFRIRLTDVCGATSNALDGEFTVTGGAADDDVTDDDQDDDTSTDDDTTYDDGLLQNGDFEDVGDHWDQNPDRIISSKLTMPAQVSPLPSGNWAAFFDDTATTMTLSQEFAIPADVSDVRIEFMSYIVVAQTGSGSDTMLVQLLDYNDQIITDATLTLTNADQYLGWRAKSMQVDVNAYRKKIVKLRFQVTSSGDMVTYFFVDNVGAIPLD